MPNRNVTKPHLPRKTSRALKAAEKAFSRGEIEKGLASFQEAMAATRNDERPLLRLGLCLYYSGRSEEAEEALLRALEIAPGNPGCHLFLGIVRVDLEKRESALENFQECLSIQPDNRLARSWRAFLESECGKNVSEDQRREIRPGLWDSGFLARLLLDLEKAHRAFSQNDSITPVDVYVERPLPGSRKAKRQARTLLLSAERFLREGLFQSALEHARMALTLDSSLKEETALLLSEIFLALEQWDSLRESLKGGKWEGPMQGKANLLRGEMERRLGNHEAALEHYRKALHLLEGDPHGKAEVRLFLGLSLASLGMNREARVELERFALEAPLEIREFMSHLAEQSLLDGPSESQ